MIMNSNLYNNFRKKGVVKTSAHYYVVKRVKERNEKLTYFNKCKVDGTSIKW